MKLPSSFLTNTTTPAGRAEGQAINDPGGGTGTGIDEEIYNDPAYAALAPIKSYKDGGISDSDETTLASDMRDALEEMTDKRVTDSVGGGSLLEWDVGTTYSTLGVMVTWKGFQFVTFNNTGNLAKDPLLNPDYWYPIPKPDELLMLFAGGHVIPGGMSDMVDRAGGNYNQNIAFGRYRLGANGDDFYNFFRVMLDGTVVTGNTTLEDDIFEIGTGTEYPFADIFCPDVIGTRTLLDLGEYVMAAQSDSGENDTLGEIQDDRFQGHEHQLKYNEGNDGNILAAATTFIGRATAGSVNYHRATGPDINTAMIGDAINDGTNGTPRDGLTTRPKELTEGVSSIIVMVAV